MNTQTLQERSLRLRLDLIEMIYGAGGGHTGGSLSALDILVTLYNSVLRIDPHHPDWPERDRFVMSKGHSVEALYCVLADRGFFSREELWSYGKLGSRLFGHPTIKVPGIELNTGALGHGFSVAVGMAIGAQRDGSDVRVFALMGDGEQAEGSVWEAAMAAGHYGLANLTAIIDRNRLQISGDTENVMRLDDLAARYRAFGFQVEEIDGHDHGAMARAFARRAEERPRLFIANTVKGKGVSFIERNFKWHHQVPSAEEYAQALGELRRKLAEVTHVA